MSMSKFATMEDYYKHRAAEVEKQNAELLEALADCLDDLEHLTVMDEDERGTGRTLKQLEADGALSETILKARALIAKHGGGI